MLDSNVTMNKSIVNNLAQIVTLVEHSVEQKNHMYTIKCIVRLGGQTSKRSNHKSGQSLVVWPLNLTMNK